MILEKPFIYLIEFYTEDSMKSKYLECWQHIKLNTEINDEYRTVLLMYESVTVIAVVPHKWILCMYQTNHDGFAV